MSQISRWLITSVAASLPINALWAADYPNKPIRMLVGFPAGGSTDVLSRQIEIGRAHV